MMFQSKTPRIRAARLLVLVAVLGLQACTEERKPTVTGFEIGGRTSHPILCLNDAGESRECTAAEREALLFVEVGKEMTVTPLGTGQCGLVSVDYGDGSRFSMFDVPLEASVTPTSRYHGYVYQGWPGKKRIHVTAGNGCLGDVAKEIEVGIGPDGRDFQLGLCYGPQCPAPRPVTAACNIATGPNGQQLPPLRAGSTVRIQTNGRSINYGSNQVFNASGDPSVQTPAGYPFPNRRKFSLVYRVGTENFQGEAGQVIFRPTQTGALEICMNDNPSYLTDNTGHMMLSIRVNETSIP